MQVIGVGQVSVVRLGSKFLPKIVCKRYLFAKQEKIAVAGGLSGVNQG